MDNTESNEEYDGPTTKDFNMGDQGDEHDIDDVDDIIQQDEASNIYIDLVMNFSQQINMDAVKNHDMSNTTSNAT